MFKRLIASLVCLTFSFSNIQYVHAQAGGPAIGGDFSVNQLPVPGTMVGESAPFAPLTLKGLIVNPQKPLEFQFIVDTGKGPQDTASVKNQANQLVKYFLAGLTIPEGDLWVNLSPYEKDRMVPSALGQTELGRDLLAQDYILKQLTASLIYPEKDLGKAFWSRVYAKAQQQFGTTNIPVNTFNKVWILPDQAQVYENVNAAYVTKSTLKVMLDEDYLAKQQHQATQASSVSSQVVRQIILPEIEKEVNTGKNFAPLRQIYQALILAKWYKETIQNGLLDAVYTNKKKVAGVNLSDPVVKEQIYERYLSAYKKGVFNYIKEDPTPDGQVMPRKYFSGGTNFANYSLGRTHDGAMLSKSLATVAAGALLLFTFGCNKSNEGQNKALQNQPSQVQTSPEAVQDQTAIDEMVMAAGQGDLTKVQEALSSKIDINGVHSAGPTALMAASFGGQKEMVKFLIDKGANVHAKRLDGVTALILASQNGYKDIVELLLAKGADVNAKRGDGATALMSAVEQGHIEVVKLLVEKGANLNIQKSQGYTALMIAAQKRQSDIVKYLIEKGANVNIKNIAGSPALMEAAINGYIDIAKLLVENGADLNNQNQYGATALMMAAQNGHEGITALLIHKQANLNLKDNHGETALMDATSSGHKDIVKMFITNGADVNSQSILGTTALEISSQDGNEEITQLLINKGAEVNSVDKNGTTALMVASKQGHKGIVEMLIKNGAKVNVQDVNGVTAIGFAIFKGNLEVVKLFANNGGDLNTKGPGGFTFLMTAAAEGYPEIVSFLLEKGANLEEKNTDGVTALMLASAKGQEETVGLLLKNGANVNATNNDGHTALDFAKTENQIKVVEILKAAGAKDNVIPQTPSKSDKDHSMLQTPKQTPKTDAAMLVTKIASLPKEAEDYFNSYFGEQGISIGDEKNVMILSKNVILSPGVNEVFIAPSRDYFVALDDGGAYFWSRGIDGEWKFSERLNGLSYLRRASDVPNEPIIAMPRVRITPNGQYFKIEDSEYYRQKNGLPRVLIYRVDKNEENIQVVVSKDTFDWEKTRKAIAEIEMDRLRDSPLLTESEKHAIVMVEDAHWLAGPGIDESEADTARRMEETKDLRNAYDAARKKLEEISKPKVDELIRRVRDNFDGLVEGKEVFVPVSHGSYIRIDREIAQAFGYPYQDMAMMSGADEVLLKIFNGLFSGDLGEQTHAALAFRHIRHMDPVHVESIVARVNQLLKSKDYRQRANAALVGAFLRDRGTTLALLPLLKDENWMVRMNSANALKEIRDERAAADLLERLKVEQNDSVKAHIISALGALQYTSARGVILNLINSKNSEVARAATWADSMIRNDVPPLSLGGIKGVIPTLMESFTPRQTLIARLAKDPVFVDGLIETVFSNDDTPSELIEAVAMIKGDAVTESIIKHLRDSNDVARRRAITILAVRGGEEAQEALLDTFHNGASYWDKQTAAWALGILNSGKGSSVSSQVMDALNEGLHDIDVNMIRASVVALGHIGGEQALNEILGVIENEDELSVLSSMMDALVQIGDSRGISVVVKLKGHPQQMVRLRAQMALSEIKDKAMLQTPGKQGPDAVMFAKTKIAAWKLTGNVVKILTMLGNEDYSVRQAAEEALAKLGASREQMVNGYIAALSSKNRDAQFNAVVKLGALGDKRAVEQLLRMLKDKDWLVPTKVAEALIAIGYEHKDVLGKLLSRKPEGASGDLLPFWEEALAYKEQGYDFKVIYQPELSHHVYYEDDYGSSREVDRLEVLKIERGDKLPSVDKAMKGGIDLNQINVLRNGKTVNVQFDPAQLNELMQGGFEGFTPVIINITPIQSPFQLLGINPAKEPAVLAKV